MEMKIFCKIIMLLCNLDYFFSSEKLCTLKNLYLKNFHHVLKIFLHRIKSKKKIYLNVSVRINLFDEKMKTFKK